MATHAHLGGHDSSPSLECCGLGADEDAARRQDRQAKTSDHVLTESVMPAAPWSYIPKLRAPATTRPTQPPRRASFLFTTRQHAGPSPHRVA